MISLALSLSFLNLATDSNLTQLQLPPGYRIEVVARAENVRQLALATDGTLFAGSRRAGNIYAFLDRDNNGDYEQTLMLKSGLNMPSGVAIKGNDLYVAEVHRILRFPDILPFNPDRIPQPEVYFQQLPDTKHHGWKYLKASPKGELHFNIGAPCNICLPDKPYATLAKINQQRQLELIALGVRNSVGFDWHPQSGQLWFTENGRDHLGDDLPSDELNHLAQPGQHFGYPWVHAGDVIDPSFNSRAPEQFTPPAYKLGAHVAPLGMTFYHGEHFPDADQNTLYIAEHGSWNRSSKVGYRIVKLQLLDGKIAQHEVFIQGWLQGQDHWGRPNDVLVDHNGNLLISDDYANQIYRVSWQ